MRIPIDGTLQVRNISADTTETELAELFAQAGEVLDASIVRDSSNGASRLRIRDEESTRC